MFLLTGHLSATHSAAGFIPRLPAPGPYRRADRGFMLLYCCLPYDTKGSCSPHEGRDPSRIQRSHHHLRLRAFIPYAVDPQRGYTGRNLLPLSSVFYGSPKACGHRGSCRAVPEKIPESPRKEVKPRCPAGRVRLGLLGVKSGNLICRRGRAKRRSNQRDCFSCSPRNRSRSSRIFRYCSRWVGVRIDSICSTCCC